VNGDAYANQGATAETVASAFSKRSGVLSCFDLVALIAYDEGQAHGRRTPVAEPRSWRYLLGGFNAGGPGSRPRAGDQPNADQRGVSPRSGCAHAPIHRNG
jgi:hypothetical protein